MTAGSDPAKSGKSGPPYNQLALLFLGLTIFMLVCYGMIFLAPGVFFNPFPPYTVVALSTIAPTPTLGPTLPPTWTPTPRVTIPPSPTRPTSTAQPTRTRPPTRTPLPTETPTPSITPTPTEDLCKSLVLLGPPPATKYNQYDIVTLVWKFGRPLGPDEHFDVLLDPPGSGMSSIAWADSDPAKRDCTTYCEHSFGVADIYPGGRFLWTIEVIRQSRNGAITTVCKAPTPYFFEH
jgi:hypothetical protein